ncbi:hypothetical protein J3F83DRAFT_585709 [Trichoderma novae-zelandiae]
MVCGGGPSPSASRLSAKERALIAPTSPPVQSRLWNPRQHALPDPGRLPESGAAACRSSSWPCLGQCIRVRLQCSGGKPGGWRHTAAAAANGGRPAVSPCTADASLRGQGAMARCARPRDTHHGGYLRGYLGGSLPASHCRCLGLVTARHRACSLRGVYAGESCAWPRLRHTARRPRGRASGI